jgi:hypothetical protein
MSNPELSAGGIEQPPPPHITFRTGWGMREGAIVEAHGARYEVLSVTDIMDRDCMGTTTWARAVLINAK